MSVEKSGRGVLYIKWGTAHDHLLQRSIESLKKLHPELPVHVHELPPESTLLDKAKMFDVSPFEETLYLDVDTLVMGKLDFGFEQAKRFGISCTICECPWAKRYQGLRPFREDMPEYNTGVIFFSLKSEAFFQRWEKMNRRVDSSIKFKIDGKDAIMPLNDQAGFAETTWATEIHPAVLAMNWNLRPEWQRNWFGGIKIWHDYRDVPANVQAFNDQQSQPGAIIEYFPGIDWSSTIKVSADPVRLNMGDEAIDGFASTKNGTPVDMNSADEIVASHVLQKFSHRKTMDILTGWVSALKPGGTLRIAVPDHHKIVEAYNHGLHGDQVENWWLGAQESEDDYHKAMFTELALRQAMLSAGLVHIKPWTSAEGSKAAHPISLNLCGRKPKPIKIEGVQAVMSVPRYASTASYDSIARTLIATGIPLRTGFGAYYDHVLTFVVEDILEQEKDTSIVLALDYDSIIRPNTVMELYRLMQEHPEADAICGVQMRRGHEAPLLVLEGPDGKYDPAPKRERFAGELTEALSAHFGCTMIRTEVFKKLKRPWFQGIPSEDGRWRGGSFVAPDVNYWHQFKAQGFKLFQANDVPIGHLEETLFWGDENMRRIMQDIADYRSNGMPLGVRR